MADLQAVLERLLPSELNLQVVATELGIDALELTLRSARSCVHCPKCESPSSSVHSHYQRHVQDLPWSSLPVTLHLVVRRFRCQVARCSRRVFAERFPALAEPFSRCTSALHTVLRRVALSVGGEPGKRLLQTCHISTSGDRLLAVLRHHHPTQALFCRVVGIDDFALRKGQTYGTVVVDLETRQPIDLLPDRTASTVSVWLAEHPEIEVVSRDRSTEYERAVTLGAPQATQVMDRFHVVKNLREALERQLRRYQTSLDDAKLDLMPQPAVPRSLREEAERQRTYERRKAKVARVKEMHARGKAVSEISRELRCSAHFVRFSLRVDVVPETRHRTRKSAIDAYDEYLWQQWQAGERNAQELLRQIRARGYPNGYKRVHQWVMARRIEEAARSQGRSGQSAGKSPYRKSDFLPGQVAWLLLRDDDDLRERDRALFDKLKEKCTHLVALRELAQGFRRLIRDGSEADLDAWLEAARNGEFQDLRTFAASLARERAALLAAVTTAWSNGPTEGVVNKIKLVKRQMFGRGSFELLRKRVLLAA